MDMLKSKIIESQNLFLETHLDYCQTVITTGIKKETSLVFQAEANWKREDFQRVLSSIFDNRNYSSYQANYNFDLLDLEVKDYNQEFLQTVWDAMTNPNKLGGLSIKSSYTLATALQTIFSDWYNIHYIVKSGEDTNEEMSPGKKALVLLELLISLKDSKCPILIDQPEDDLDNRSIYEDLVQYIKSKKLERQIIVVTHNANVVLGADAEDIIICYNEKNLRISIMATYFELKRYIGKLFGQRDLEDNDDDISVSLTNRRSYSDGNSISFIISNSDLKDLYDKVSEFSTGNLEFMTPKSYEVAVNLDYPFLHRDDCQIISNDVSNGIKYTLASLSIEYCIFLLLEIIDSYKTDNRRPVILMRLHRSIDYCHRPQNSEEVTFQTLLPQMIDVLSLKIDADKPTTQSDFREYKTSFSFQFMYRSGVALIEFLDIDDIFHLNRTIRDRIDFTQFDTPPLRKYSSDVVDYYKLALASNDPYIEYLSFYHVMEYFYDEVFKNKMVEDLRAKITHPDFVYKDDDKVYQIALFVKNRM